MGIRLPRRSLSFELELGDAEDVRFILVFTLGTIADSRLTELQFLRPSQPLSLDSSVAFLFSRNAGRAAG
jgi:hypothetical protein